MEENKYKTSQIPTNFKNNVNWIMGAYADAGVSFPNGFQKDAIQNSVGARQSDSWQAWRCDISHVSTSHGDFIIVEDFGTTGLTGKNRTTDEINEMVSNGTSFAGTERLSRFTSMFNSGDNKNGPGLYGAGKSVYSVASETYTYYFDSLRKDDGLYVANCNRAGSVMTMALEGDEAKLYIAEQTGLEEKKMSGTRVIISSPKKELVDAIDNGSIISDIQESWWRIIDMLPPGSAITVNGEQITMPNVKSGAKHFYELPSAELVAPGYRVKHFGFYVFDDNSVWKDVAYYRQRMKVGEVNLKRAGIPKKLEGKYWGYVEVDREWESELATIEDNVHFGVSKGKKLTASYQTLINYCMDKIRSLLIQWGYIKDNENEDKRISDIMHKAADNIQNLFEKMGVDDLGKGARRPTFDVRWQDVKYPEKNSESVTTNDVISFAMRIKSSYSIDKNFEYSLDVVDPQTSTLVSKIDSGKIKVEASKAYVKSFTHVVTRDNSIHKAENRIRLIVKPVNGGKTVKKEMRYFFDMDQPDNRRDSVVLTQYECHFPTANSKRVNFDESLSHVIYKVENKRNYTLKCRISVSIHKADDPNIVIVKNVAYFDGEIDPYGEAKTPAIDQITFDKATFEPYLSAGPVELRARLTALEDDEQFEKGDKISSHSLKIYLNQDEKHGHADSFDINNVRQPNDCRRSWRIPGARNAIVLNIEHPAFQTLSSLQNADDMEYRYIHEQMLKQATLLYIDEGHFDMFEYDGKQIADMDSLEAYEAISWHIEDFYKKSLE